MLEESDNSDSWGSLLINGILSKINQMSGKNHDDDHENHLLIGSKKPQISNEVPKKMVKKKVIMKGQYPPLTLLKKKGENKFTPAPVPEYTDWCKERQKLGYGQKTVTSHPNDFTEKKKVVKIKNEKSSRENDQNLVQPEKSQTTDLLDKDKVIKSLGINVQNLVQPRKFQTTDSLEKDKEIKSLEVKVQNIVQPGNYQVNPTFVDSFGGRRINFIPSNSNLVNTQNFVSNYQVNPTSVDSFGGRRINFIPSNSNLVNAQNVVQPSRSQTTDLLENNKEIKSSEVNVLNLVQPSKYQIPDFIEKEIKLEQVSLAPVKSSESSPVIV